MKYQRILVRDFGPAESMELVEEELPEPQAGEVRVKILATGIIFADIAMREGFYPVQRSLPFTPGYDMLGVVDKLGEGVTSTEVGQTVASLTVTGAYAQYICLPATELVPVPEGLDPAEALCMVVSYLTAYQIMHREGKIKRGERILVHGAAGGVGTALLQLGALMDAELYGTASKRKHQVVSDLGATPIDYKNEDFVESIASLTGDGVDIVFDSVGGDYYERSYKALREGGRLVSFGSSKIFKGGQYHEDIYKEGLATLERLNNLPDGRTAVDYFVEATKASHPEWFYEDLTTLFQLLKEKKIQPVIAERLPLAKAGEAHKMVENFAVEGKVVLICN